MNIVKCHFKHEINTFLSEKETSAAVLRKHDAILISIISILRNSYLISVRHISVSYKPKRILSTLFEYYTFNILTFNLFRMPGTIPI